MDASRFCGLATRGCSLRSLEIGRVNGTRTVPPVGGQRPGFSQVEGHEPALAWRQRSPLIPAQAQGWWIWLCRLHGGSAAQLAPLQQRPVQAQVLGEVEDTMARSATRFPPHPLSQPLSTSPPSAHTHCGSPLTALSAWARCGACWRA